MWNQAGTLQIAEKNSMLVPMKICIISNIYPPYHRGGAEQVVVKTVQGLQQAGHSVVVITAAPEESLTHKPSLTIHRIHPRNVFFYTQANKHGFLVRALWHVFDMFHIGVARQVNKILVEEQPDIVHTHNLMGLGFLIPHVVRKRQLPHVHTVHDVQLVEPSGVILKKQEHNWRYTGFPTKMYTAIMRKLMGSPHVVISPSTFLKNFYERRGFFLKSSTHVIQNPLTFALDAQKHIHEKEKPLQCLYIGQVEMHKGIAVLVEALIAMSEKELEKIAVHIVGSGAALAWAKEELADVKSVTIHGKKDRASLPDIFRKMDVSIVPSLCYENSPTVIFESFAFGVPVIASDIEGVAELVDVGVNGWTFLAGDSDALRQRLLSCAVDKEGVHQMREKTQQAVTIVAKIDYGRELIALYQQALRHTKIL